MAPHDPSARAPPLVRPDRKARRGGAPLPGQFDDVGRPAAHRDRRGAPQRWFEIWYQPKIDLKRKCLAGAEALARIHHPDLRRAAARHLPAGCRRGQLARLTEHALSPRCTTGHVRGRRLQPASRHQRPGERAAAPADPDAGGASTGRKSERWPGIIVEVNEDQIVRDIKLAQEIANKLRVSGVTICDRRFRRRLFVVLEPARIAVRRAQARQQLREGLRDRRHQRRHLPDRDRPRAPLRQRGGRRRHRELPPTCRRCW